VWEAVEAGANWDKTTTSDVMRQALKKYLHIA